MAKKIIKIKTGTANFEIFPRLLPMLTPVQFFSFGELFFWFKSAELFFFGLIFSSLINLFSSSDFKTAILNYLLNLTGLSKTDLK